MNPLPLVLDTDIGDDVDDALALAVALRSPEIDLRGVTTVFRDAPRRALLAREVLKLYAPERADSLPVVAGCSQPLVLDWNELPGGQSLGRQFEALDPNLPLPTGNHALEFLAGEIQKAQNAGERLTVAGIGPLTNLALLVARYPELIGAYDVLLMAGKWSDDFAEWNIRCDPEAAAMVFRSGVPLQMVGLDVTEQCVLSDEEVARFDAATPRAKFLGDLIKLWGHKVTLHDPLTLLTPFSDCVKFAPKRIEVQLSGARRASTKAVEGEANVRVATEVDVEAAKALFLERVLS